jgi:hypothetical protein
MVLPNNTLDQSTVTTYVSQFEDIIVTKFVIALIILFVGLLVGLLCGKIVRKLLKELEINTFFKNHLGLDIKLDEVLSTGLTWAIYVLTVLLVLYQLGVATFVVNTVSIFIIILAIVLITISMKDFVPNFIAGLRISRRDLFTIGDQVRVDRFEGTIVDIELLEVLVETKGGDILMVPSSYLMHNVVRIKAGPTSREQGRLPSLIKVGIFAKKSKKQSVKSESVATAQTLAAQITASNPQSQTQMPTQNQTLATAQTNVILDLGQKSTKKANAKAKSAKISAESPNAAATSSFKSKTKKKTQSADTN